MEKNSSTHLLGTIMRFYIYIYIELLLFNYESFKIKNEIV